jgi:hypothetical protein
VTWPSCAIDRALILGSDAAYREWATSPGHAPGCRPASASAPDAVDEHHTATGGDRRSIDDGRPCYGVQPRPARRARLGAAHVVRRDPPAHVVGALGERPAQPGAGCGVGRGRSL